MSKSVLVPTEDPGYLAALSFVNDLRLRCKRPLLAELPQGRPKRPRHCPIALALVDVIGPRVRVNDRAAIAYDIGGAATAEFPFQLRVADFIHHFDDGHFPTLIDRTTPIATDS